MSMSTIATGPSAAPLHLADLRPVADGAATRRDTDPSLPVAQPVPLPAVTPPSATGRAEVGRSLLAAEATAQDRRLKPWGVAMLPSSARSEATDPRATAPDQPADPGPPGDPATTLADGRQPDGPALSPRQTPGADPASDRDR